METVRDTVDQVLSWLGFKESQADDDTGQTATGTDDEVAEREEARRRKVKGVVLGDGEFVFHTVVEQNKKFISSYVYLHPQRLLAAFSNPFSRGPPKL